VDKHASALLASLATGRRRGWALPATLILLALLPACASVPVPVAPPSSGILLASPLPLQQRLGFSIGSEIVVRAIALLGTPYQYGGNGPETFDCSGLVRYIHNELGINVPRTAAEQYRAAAAVDVDHLEPGDLLFFKTQGDGVSHVAIYAGSGRFVHAPQTGKTIELRELDDGYYKPRLVGAGRLFPKVESSGLPN
jgi:murein DD-endopeptidase